MSAEVVDQIPETGIIPADDPLSPFIWIHPGRMSGAPCFTDSRVPLLHLRDYLSEGYPLAEFLDAFEGVTEEQAKEVLRLAFDALLEKLPKP